MCKSDTCQDTLDTLGITSELFNKRAERKAVTQSQIGRLLQLNSPLHSQYERTDRCCSIFSLREHKVTLERKIFTSYCKNRFCTVCSAIKTAELMNSYFRPVSELKDLHFVTLTVPSVKAERLKSELRKMIKTFTKIKDSMRKSGHSMTGIRKIECNYNPVADTYNPHFHLIISGRIRSVELVDRWLSHNPEAVIEAQNIQKACQDSLKELFKYSVKSVVGKRFYPIAQDVIYQALSGLRTFQNFGELRKDSETTQNSELDTEYQIEDNDSLRGEWRLIECYFWSPKYCNWISDSGEILHQVKIRKKVSRLVNRIRSG